MTAVLDASVNTATPGPSLVTTVGAILDALNTVGVAVASRPGLPILGGVRLDVAGDTAKLGAFDYDTSVIVELDGAGHSGSAVLSHGELVKVLKAAVKGETKRTYETWPVIVETVQHGIGDQAETTATVTVGGFTVPVRCFRAADYPTLPGQHRDDTFTIDRGTLADMLARVGAAGGDETLPVLTGVRVELDHGRVTMAATDRFRLAVASADVQSAAASGGWLFPHKRLAAVVKTLPDGPVTFSVGTPDPRYGYTQPVTVRAGDVTATVRLIDAEFPRFRMLFPSEVTSVVTVDRAALVKTVVKAQALGKAVDSRQGLIVLDAGDGVTVAPHVSEARGARVDAGVTGVPVRFGVNGDYLADALNTFSGDTVVLGLTSPNRLIVVADDEASLTDQQAGYRHLVMPARLAS